MCQLAGDRADVGRVDRRERPMVPLDDLEEARGLGLRGDGFGLRLTLRSGHGSGSAGIRSLRSCHQAARPETGSPGSG